MYLNSETGELRVMPIQPFIRIGTKILAVDNIAAVDIQSEHDQPVVTIILKHPFPGQPPNVVLRGERARWFETWLMQHTMDLRII